MVAVLGAAGFYFAFNYGRGGCCAYRARNHHSYHGTGFSHLEFMKSNLGLTGDQEKKIFDIGTRYRQLYFENRDAPEKTRELMQAHRKENEGILTKEQLEKWKNFDRPGRICPYMR